MSSDKLSEAIKRIKFDVPATLKTVSLALCAVGAAGFVAALAVDADAAWRAYLSNFIYVLGIASGAFIWSVVMRITSARWGRSLMRLWEGGAFFLPVALLLYVGLVVGGYASHLFPWVHHTIHHKEAWLAPEFVFARGAFWLLLLTCAALFYVYHSLKSDVRVLKGAPHVPEFFARLFAGADGSEAEWRRSQRILLRFSPIMAIIYAVTISMLSFDLVMSLEPYWYSTMFGGFVFMGNMFLGLAFIAIVAGAVRGRGLLEGYIGKNQFWDVGKLLFAFSMVWTYLMWSQYLPIWYGNMAEETGYVIKRTAGPYRDWAFLILALCWLLPWFWLLPRGQKQRPLTLGIGAAVIFVGMWLERWTMVIPAQFEVAPVPAELAIFPGWIDVVTGCLFTGLFLLSYRFFLQGTPILPVGDPVFQDVAEHGSHGHH